jgi:hypothetical protein
MGFTANAANAALIDVTIAGGYRINMPVGIFSGAGLGFARRRKAA